MLDILDRECRILGKGYVKEKVFAKKLEDLILVLAKYVEENIYLTIESQEYCELYIWLCEMKSEMISSSIPEATHYSEYDQYPWSMLRTREEHFKMYYKLKEMFGWAFKALKLKKNLVIMNPSVRNVENYISAIKIKFVNLDYYNYRSLETIKAATVDEDDYLIVSKEALRKDEQFKFRIKLQLLIELCNMFRSEMYSTNKYAQSIFLLVANNIFYLYAYFREDDFLKGFAQQLTSIENDFINEISEGVSNPDSLVCYVLQEIDVINDLEKLQFACDSKAIRKLKNQIKLSKSFNNKWQYDAELREVLREWLYLR